MNKIQHKFSNKQVGRLGFCLTVVNHEVGKANPVAQMT